MLHRLYRVSLVFSLLSISFLFSAGAQIDTTNEDTTRHITIRDDTDIAVPTGEFTVQVGAFSSKRNAQRLGARFRRDGWSTDVYNNVLDRKRNYYLVWIGTYASLDEAHRQLALIEKKYGIRGVIRQRMGWKK